MVSTAWLSLPHEIEELFVMHVDIVAATPELRPIVERLVQLYEHDSSEFVGSDVDPDGLYRLMDLDALWRPSYHVFLVTVDNRLAGFAFVTRHQSYLGQGDTWLMDEFFVMRKYRRRGTGTYVAHMLFTRFPGRWEVAQVRASLGAQAFWRRVIGRYTHGDFQEVDLDTSRWRGPVQQFESVPVPATEAPEQPGNTALAEQ
ncbi:MAG: GNAT family N-acetyltransferase [Thermomicrobiales bacterium]